MLRKRLLYGPVLIAALVLVVWIDQRFARTGPGVGEWFLRPGFALLLIGMAICPLAAWELKQLFRALGASVSRGMLITAGIIGMSLVWVIPEGLRAVTAMMLVATAGAGVLVVALVWHSRTRSPKGATIAAGAALLSFVYFGLMFGFFLALRREHTAWVVLGVLCITKSCDIGAFFTGTLVGRHKLIFWLSPGKTWEGLAGGVALAGGLGIGFAWLIRSHNLDGAGISLEWWHGAFLGVLLAITGQTGDLLASLLKRDAGVKDSSRLVPGFGGVLDLIDSILPAAPVAYWLLHRG